MPFSSTHLGMLTIHSYLLFCVIDLEEPRSVAPDRILLKDSAALAGLEAVGGICSFTLKLIARS